MTNLEIELQIQLNLVGYLSLAQLSPSLLVFSDNILIFYLLS